jgi:hypothetical protein
MYVVHVHDEMYIACIESVIENWPFSQIATVATALYDNALILGSFTHNLQ